MHVHAQVIYGLNNTVVMSFFTPHNINPVRMHKRVDMAIHVNLTQAWRPLTVATPAGIFSRTEDLKLVHRA